MTSPAANLRPLRVAAIGAGYVAKWQLPAWQQIDSVELVAICDTDLDRARTAADLVGIGAVYTDSNVMLDEADPDAVDILTTPNTHLELVSLAAEHGKPVLCQKPLASSLEDARTIVDICRENSIRLMVNENFRWRPSYRWVRDHLANQTIGRVFYAGFNSRINVTQPSVQWAKGRLFTYRPFFLDVERLIILENTIHWIDVSRFLFGEPQSVYCQTQRSTDLGRGEDTATVILNYEDINVVIQNAWGSYGYPYPSPEALVAIEGTEGTIFIDRDGAGSLAHPDGSVTASPYDVDDYYESSFRASQAHFVDCLASGQEFETTGEDNLRSLALTAAAYRSAKENRVVSATEIEGMTQ